MNPSMGSPDGGRGFTGFSNAQCPLYSAPSATQRRRVSASSSLYDFRFRSTGGGIISSGSSEPTRLTSSLSSGLPGMMRKRPSCGSNAPCFVSSRRSAFRLPASGPWQGKQCSARTGRTSRSKSTRFGPVGRSAATLASAASAMRVEATRWRIIVGEGSFASDRGRPVRRWEGRRGSPAAASRVAGGRTCHPNRSRSAREWVDRPRAAYSRGPGGVRADAG